jgi:hypothetical protein
LSALSAAGDGSTFFGSAEFAGFSPEHAWSTTKIAIAVMLL